VSGRTQSVGAKPVEGPRPKLTGRAAALLVAVALLALLAVSPVRAYVDQRAEIAELERQAQVLEDTNAKLRVDITKLHKPAELERLARECLGMVKTGEVALVTAPDAGGSAPFDC
jgi:cell division protein FtsL